eukprot:5201754-Ditylum_brightwellii.AAC.1
METKTRKTHEITKGQESRTRERAWIQKRMKNTRKEKKRRIKNTEEIEEFKMRSDEDWKATFCRKCAAASPTWK